jgi:hypothetical protein
MPDMTGFDRWHLAEPIVFREDLKVTVQQIGAVYVRVGQEEKRKKIEASNPLAGPGWQGGRGGRIADWGIAERSDDYSAAAFVYCREPQPVGVYARENAVGDIGRFDYEEPGDTELAMAVGYGGARLTRRPQIPDHAHRGSRPYRRRHLTPRRPGSVLRFEVLPQRRPGVV